MFFNPALFHAAGTNHTTDMRRMANLLQVSSAFGRAMETVDRRAGRRGGLPGAARGRAPPGCRAREVGNVVAASAEGYAFPTNLDRDQPVDGMAPPTQADLVTEALAADLPTRELVSKLRQQLSGRESH